MWICEEEERRRGGGVPSSCPTFCRTQRGSVAGPEMPTEENYIQIYLVTISKGILKKTRGGHFAQMGHRPISIFFEHHCKVPSVRDGVKSRTPIFFMLWKCFPKYTMSLPLQMNQYCWRKAASDVGCPKCSNMDWGCLEKGCP